MSTSRARLRLRYLYWPDPAIVLADTPRPDCDHCQGRGCTEHAYFIGDSDAVDVEDVLCDCWNPDRVHKLLPIPAWLLRLARRIRARATGYSAEPPF